MSGEPEIKELTIAVAGNPNSGKSTLINAIAGARLHVGNWPGVTVEKKEAVFERWGRRIRLVDLPGVYSLSPYSQEEVIARDYLVREDPDVIINVVDATNLERNLYLTIQLMELEKPMIIALNIYDEAEKKGYVIDRAKMESMLGVMVIPTVSTRNIGVDDLLRTTVEIAEDRETARPRRLFYGEDIESAAGFLEDKLKEFDPALVENYPSRWLAFKLMESDQRVMGEIRINGAAELVREATSHLKKAHDEDVESLMADERYALVAGLTREALTKPAIPRAELSEKIDNVVLSRILGIPIFFASMWLVFKLTFDVSAPFVDWVDETTSGPLKRWAGAALSYISTPEWLVSLATDGVVAGVGFVLAFAPVIFAMMFFITLLEGSGYMARAAFLMDRAMSSMGLHGKSFIPLLLGFGCNVPAIYATRTLESERDRILTALLVPLMSCGARLPVYALFVGVFFPRSSGTVLWSIYMLGIALAVIMGVIFKHSLFRGTPPMFIMELPPYRIPTMKNLMTHTWEKAKHFLVKAGTYIFAASILIWFFLNLPWGVVDKKDSYLGRAGQAVSPILEPLGFGQWEAASSLITGVVAKELIVSAMGEIYAAQRPPETGPAPSFTEDLKDMGVSLAAAFRKAAANIFSTFGIVSLSVEEEAESAGLRPMIQKTYTPLSAYSFMAFVLIYMPCLVTAIAFVQEFGSWRWFALAAGYELALAWIVSFTIYQGGTALGLGG